MLLFFGAQNWEIVRTALFIRQRGIDLENGDVSDDESKKWFEMILTLLWKSESETGYGFAFLFEISTPLEFKEQFQWKWFDQFDHFPCPIFTFFRK